MYYKLSILLLGSSLLLISCDHRSVHDKGIKQHDRAFLSELTKRTWDYFQLASKHNGIPSDHVILKSDRQLHPATYTSITNIGLYLFVLTAAVDLHFLSQQDCDKKLLEILSHLENMKKSRMSLFYNYYEIKHEIKAADDHYVSSVDNAWLAAGLIGLTNSQHAKIKERSKKLVDDMDFSDFYDSNKKQFRLGYSDNTGEPSPYHYGQLMSESRIISYVALAKSDVPKEHWYHLFRTLPASLQWQNQIPKGYYKSINEHQVFQGHYIVNQLPIVPSWGGSMFEFLMPLLLVPEMDLGINSFKISNINMLEIHKKHCLEDAGYPVWGLSPAAIPSGLGNYKYGEFGVGRMGSKGYPDKGIITPHASVLAIEFDTQGVIDNLKKIKELFPDSWTAYGYYDSVNVETNEVAKIYLTLDQAMIFLALHNYLTNGKTRERFYQEHMKKAIAPLLESESFFK